MTEPSWRTEARAMTEAVPYARSQRIRRRLRQRAEAATTRKRRHFAALVGFAAGAALVMLTVFVLRPAPVEVFSPRPASAPLVVATTQSEASPTLHAAGCEGELAALAESRSTTLIGLCELTAPGLRIVIAGTATMGGDARSVVLDAGEIELDVDPGHRRDMPFSVTTPAGRIEVTGTRFTVRHEPDGGAVTVHEGQVRLVMAERIRPVGAGEHVAWVAEGSSYRLVATTDEPTSAPTPEPHATASPSRRSPRKASSGALIEEVEHLRAAGRFADAAATIEAALPSLSRRDREVLSFELGKLTERSHGKAAACDHWRTYERDFARGRYADLVAEERVRLGCNDLP